MENKKFITQTWFVALAAFICCLLWGSAYPCIKIGYELFNIEASDLAGKFLFAGYRFTLAGLLVLLLCLITKKASQASHLKHGDRSSFLVFHKLHYNIYSFI
ncbi:hypothetical protein [Cellulosilyticum ruminicola]|uniref:hypothetical protein n=1 Tax=Cellulosilyticum ruminicola TaxID=425254 RepID=UPI002E8E169D|nr:hypothetical protein [Cellulosilyticum ruminicola]